VEALEQRRATLRIAQQKAPRRARSRRDGGDDEEPRRGPHSQRPNHQRAFGPPRSLTHGENDPGRLSRHGGAGDFISVLDLFRARPVSSRVTTPGKEVRLPILIKHQPAWVSASAPPPIPNVVAFALARHSEQSRDTRLCMLWAPTLLILPGGQDRVRKMEFERMSTRILCWPKAEAAASNASVPSVAKDLFV